MSTVRRRQPGILGEVEALKRKQRNNDYIYSYDPEDRPGRITGVDLEFRVRERRRQVHYKGIVTFDLFGPGFCQADVLYYIVEMQGCNKDGVPYDGGRIEREIIQAQDLDDASDANDDPRAIFKPIDQPRKVYRRVRVCAVDKDRRKGMWGGSPLDGNGDPINAGAWTNPVLPVQEARPVPPYPDNRSLSFDKEEAGRDEARYRAKVKFDEINFWDVPPTAERDKITGTLSGAITANDTTITLSSAASWPTPLPKERISFSIRPFHEDTVEVASYGGKSGNNLTDVRRGLEGTTARIHPDNANVRIAASDVMERQVDITGYEVQLRRCTVDSNGDFVAWALDSDGAYIQREHFEPWKAEHHDSNEVVRSIFPNVRKKHWWRARVRTRAEYGLKGDWSPWTDPDSPSDPDPPVPTNVEAVRGIDKVGIEWNSPGDDDDADLISEEVSYYQVQAIREPDGAGWDGADAIAAWAAIDAETGQDAWDLCWKYDKYVITTKKLFHAEQYDQKHHFRVRAVRHREKSAWRYGVKDNETEGYVETASPGSYVKPRAAREVATFTYSGDLAIDESKPRYSIDKDYEIRKVVATLDTLNTGSNVTVQVRVNINGTAYDLFTTPITFVAGGSDNKKTKTQADMIDSSPSAPYKRWQLEDGDFIKVKIESIGSTIKGADLVVQVFLRKIKDD
jgi:hypothetical protein